MNYTFAVEETQSVDDAVHRTHFLCKSHLLVWVGFELSVLGGPPKPVLECASVAERRDQANGFLTQTDEANQVGVTRQHESSHGFLLKHQLLLVFFFFTLKAEAIGNSKPL